MDFLPFVNPHLSIFLPHLHDWLTTNPGRIIAGTFTQHGHQDTQQPVPKISQSLAMALPLRPQRRIHAAEVSIVLHGDARHVIQRMAHTGVTPVPHHYQSALATLLRDGGDPAMCAQHLIVSLSQGLGRFRKEPGRNFSSDPRQR